MRDLPPWVRFLCTFGIFPLLTFCEEPWRYFWTMRMNNIFLWNINYRTSLPLIQFLRSGPSLQRTLWTYWNRFDPLTGVYQTVLQGYPVHQLECRLQITCLLPLWWRGDHSFPHWAARIDQTGSAISFHQSR